MSILDALGFGKSAASAAPAPAPAPASGAVKTEGVSGTEGIKSGPKETPAEKPKSPLDAFSDLFTIDPKAANKPTQTNPFDIDPSKIKESAGKIDFTRNINDETLEAIRGGGEEAITATLAAMNQMSQTNYAYAVALATQMAKKASEHTLEQVQQLVPDLVRNMRANEEISESNPALNHPAAQPLIKAMMQQFSIKYPDASPKELKEQAIAYLSSFGKLFQTDENAGLVDKTGIGTKRGKQASDVDWSTYLNS